VPLLILEMACTVCDRRSFSFDSTNASESGGWMSESSSTAPFDQDGVPQTLRAIRGVRFGGSELIEYLLEASETIEEKDGVHTSEAEKMEAALAMERWNRAVELRRLKRSATACIASDAAPPMLLIGSSRLWQRRGGAAGRGLVLAGVWN